MATKFYRRSDVIISQADLSVFPRIYDEVVTKADHEAALKAKDEEIRELNYLIDLKDKRIQVRGASLDTMEEKYNQLLDQAIRFAEMISSNPSPYADGVPEAQAFLTRPDVQARRKKDLPIQCDWDGTGFY